MFKVNMVREREIPAPKFTREKPPGKPVKSKGGRLVVRNLPFKATEDDVSGYFSKFGDLEEVHFLKRNGVFTGCAFVQFGKTFEAAKALAKTSGQEFKGRTIIVDWAVSKDRYDQIQKGKAEVDLKVEVKDEEVSSDEEKPDVEELNQSISGSVNVRKVFDSDSEEDGDEIKKESSDDEEEEDYADSDDDEEEGENEDDGSVEEDEESEPEDVKPDIQPRIKSERFLEIKRKHQEEDQLNQRTIFVKNVPFSASSKEFRAAAEEAGKVEYALICMDHMTEHSKGSGFIRYQDVETAEKVLSGEVTLETNGIELQVQRAKPKRSMEDGKGDEKAAKDNRNLYLAKEGVILAGTPAADGVSAGDMSKRLQLEQWKTTVLRNLHMFISPTRLVVHNVPLNYTDKTLFALFKKHSSQGARIHEAKIMKTVNNPELGKSRGYGFVSFTRHEDALAALRKINNNPEIFSAHRRPIVAFSVENKKALNIKEKRREASLKNLNKTKEERENEKAASASAKPNPVSTKNSKKKNKRKPNSPNQPPAKKAKIAAEVPKYSGVTAKFGNKKLSTKRQLLNQAAKHRETLKKVKKQKKISRKQKRMKKARTSIL